MYFLTYLSNAPTLRDLDIQAILEVSRKNNQRDEITGLLMIRDGVIFQMLEGDKGRVLSAFQRISKDARHNSIKILFEAEEDAERIFPQWQMGFVNGKLAAYQQSWLFDELKKVMDQD